MNFLPIIAAANAFAGIVLAVTAMLREKRSLALAAFSAVMLVLAFEAAGNAFSLQAVSPQAVLSWQRFRLTICATLPFLWLLFSLTYSRGNAREFVDRWRIILIALLAVPVLIVALFNDELLILPAQSQDLDLSLRLSFPGVLLQTILLVGSALVLMNFERTFRTATGTKRWRIKFLILGCGVLLGARIYTTSQAVIFYSVRMSSIQVETIARSIGLILICFSLLRARLADVDIYPSQAFLYRSLSATLAGIYLLIVGLLAKLTVVLGGDQNLPLQALVTLVGLVGLAVLLMSDRLRQRIQQSVSRHLRRPLHDYRALWAQFAQRTASLVTREKFSREVTRLISETFNVLSVTVFLFDEEKQQLIFGASTSLPEAQANEILRTGPNVSAITDWRANSDPVDLDHSTLPWVLTLKRLNPDHFRHGGSRVCVPLVASEQFLGLITLTDRVNDIPFSTEDFDLLKTIGGQTAASLLNIKLSESLLRSKELEAFQTMSTFFVHDLKNTALMLSLMLQNLPVHFANPAFREDSLRSISKTVARINDLIGRLSLLREGLKIAPSEVDLNAIVTATLAPLRDMPGVKLTEDLNPLPRIHIDSDQIQKVLTNLVLNARDAVSERGEIKVTTSQNNGWAVLQVSDNGSGISPEFLARGLFRPFQTTKKKGIGIGMYQSKMIVEAHSGRIEVESELGKGTTFRVLLPILSQK